ncbi:MAG: ABC transporter ATP-binding protein [Proteobacteria bacterium]|nr:ABC transporter ATP-binding protein [Pseudomonadota bacterium]NOG59676.1 ABC transporter ATP-binding protein [Pseudomonadota bacterium]
MEHVNITTPAFIDLHSVSKHYRQHHAIDSLDLSINKGESLALIGHNGAGKTTLLKLILGLTLPDAGSIKVNGLVPSQTSDRKKIAFLPEIVSFPASMTGRELITFYARLKGCKQSECNRLLNLVGLTDAASRKVGTYSKGMRQRLGLAQTLLGKPDLILLDEPTSGLDPSLRKQFYNILEDCKSAGTTILISSHALSEIETKTDRIAILKQGRLVIHGTLDELRNAADLSVQIRVSTQSGQTSIIIDTLEPETSYRKYNDHCIEFDCHRDDKLRVLQNISKIPSGIVDIEILPPRLDDLYIHFAGEENDESLNPQLTNPRS